MRDLDLEGSKLIARLGFFRCAMRDIALRDARTHALAFDGTHIGSMIAERARIEGSLLLRNKFRAANIVSLAGATISGQLDCSNSQFEGLEKPDRGENQFTEVDRSGGAKKRIALDCNALNVGTNVYLRGDFHAKGEINLSHTTIGGQLDCSGGQFENAGDTALKCDALATGTGVYLCNGFRAIGEVNLTHATIGDQLECSGGYFEYADCPDDKAALNADALVVGTDLCLNVDDRHCSFQAIGGVRLRGAKIDGQLCCVGAQFRKGKRAFDGDALSVGGDVLLRTKVNKKRKPTHQFIAIGEFNLRGANVRGQLDCSGAWFHNDGEIALCGDSLTTGSSIFLRDGFCAIGEVDFVHATIGGMLECSNGHFANRRKEASAAEETSGTTTDQELNATALGLRSAVIRGTLDMTHIVCMDGTLDLHGAAVQSLSVDLTALPKLSKQESFFRALILGICAALLGRGKVRDAPLNVIKLDGFTYQRFGSSIYAEALLRALKRQPPKHLKGDFRAQPWAQVIKVLREMGHDEDARTIAIERAKALARRPETHWYGRLWGWILGGTVGHGYRPWYAAGWSVPIFLIGWLTFAAAGHLGYMAPRESGANVYMTTHAGRLPPHYPEFESFVYALDVFLPVIELGQDRAWGPTMKVFPGAERNNILTWLAARKRNVESTALTVASLQLPGLYVVTAACSIAASLGSQKARARAWLVRRFDGGWHEVVYWFEIILGWIFVSLFIAGMSGLMKKE